MKLILKPLWNGKSQEKKKRERPVLPCSILKVWIPISSNFTNKIIPCPEGHFIVTHHFKKFVLTTHHPPYETPHSLIIKHRRLSWYSLVNVYLHKKNIFVELPNYWAMSKLGSNKDFCICSQFIKWFVIGYSCILWLLV